MNQTADTSEARIEAQETALDCASGTLEAVDDCWNRIGVTGDGTCSELAKFVHCRNCPVYSRAGAQLLNRRIPAEYRQEWTRHISRVAKVEGQLLPARLSGLDSQRSRLSVVIFRLGDEWLALPTQTLQEVVALGTAVSPASGDEAQAPGIDLPASALAPRCVIHSLPHRRGSVVLGLVNVRGELVICVSLGRLLSGGCVDENAAILAKGSAASPATQPVLQTTQPRSYERSHTRLLVAEWDGSRLVFPVHEVHGVHRLQPEQLKDPPATLAGDKRRTKVAAPAAGSNAVIEMVRHGGEPAGSISYVRSIFAWNDKTVGLLDADLLFASLNHNLA